MQKNKSLSCDPINRTKDNPFGIQKSYLEYYEPGYLKPNRMSSYGYQYKLAMEANSDTYLNVGSANDLLNYLLLKQGKFIVDLDIDKETRPRVTAKIPDLPFSSKSFDVVMCFQVLEHMPFSFISQSLKELNRIACRQIILSLPDITQSKKGKFKYRFFSLFKRPRKWQIYKPRSIDPEHFWEIGAGDINLDMVISCFQKENLTIFNHFRNELYPYHHFFVLEKSEDSSN